MGRKGTKRKFCLVRVLIPKQTVFLSYNPDLIIYWIYVLTYSSAKDIGCAIFIGSYSNIALKSPSCVAIFLMKT